MHNTHRFKSHRSSSQIIKKKDLACVKQDFQWQGQWTLEVRNHWEVCIAKKKKKKSEKMQRKNLVLCSFSKLFHSFGVTSINVCKYSLFLSLRSWIQTFEFLAACSKLWMNHVWSSGRRWGWWSYTVKRVSWTVQTATITPTELCEN